MVTPEVRPGDSWYFAYGSNLDPEQKESRTGRIREARRCHLPDYRFAFNKRSDGGAVYANLMPQRGARVWGVVYRCSPDALEKMDRCEGVAGGHYVRTSVRVVTDSSEALKAEAYTAGQRFVCADGIPEPSYLRRIVKGAREHQLPEEYIRTLEALGAPRRQAGQ